MATATMENRNGPFTVLPGQKLLGEILTWNCNAVTIRHSDLIEALRSADLDEGVARELAPRHAFRRACKKLSEARIIRQVNEDEGTISFQFTSEEKDGDRFVYEMETVLKLDKQTGSVSCDLAGLAALAQEELDRCIDARTASDVTRIIQKLFERKADLFPIRERGGCYFAPQEHVGFVDRVERFVQQINGRLSRFPIPAGTPQGDRSVKEAVASGLQAVIDEHEQAIAGFGEDTRPSTIERAAERIKVTRHKIEVYACYLADEKERLEKAIAEASSKLRLRIDELATGKSA